MIVIENNILNLPEPDIHIDSYVLYTMSGTTDITLTKIVHYSEDVKDYETAEERRNRLEGEAYNGLLREFSE